MANFFVPVFCTQNERDLIMSDDSTTADPYFDIRPALEAGESREMAVQAAVDRFHEDVEAELGDRYVAMVGTHAVLSTVLKALFDEEYGADAFGLEQAQTALARFRTADADPPRVSDPQLQQDLDTFDANPPAVEQRLLDSAQQCVNRLRTAREPVQG